jgi:hypothetical protein
VGIGQGLGVPDGGGIFGILHRGPGL